MHQCIFAEGWPHLFPQSRREWETQKLPPKKKGGSSVLDPGLHKKAKPQGLFQTARSDGGTIWKAREIFPAARDSSSVMHRRIFTEGRPCSPPNPEWDGKTKLPLLLRKVGVVFIKAEPIDKAEGKKTGKRLGGASCTLPQPLQMRKLKCMPPPAFRAAFSFPPVKTSCFIGAQSCKKFVVLPADEMVKIPNFYPQVSFLHCAGGGFLLC